MSDPDEDADNREWTKQNIVSSVMEFGDFARYVIGTNFHNSNWLSLRLDEEPWRSIETQEEALSLKLSDSERLVWEEYQNAEIEFEILRRIRLIREESRQAEDQNTPSEEDKIIVTPDTGEFIRRLFPILHQNNELPEKRSRDRGNRADIRKRTGNATVNVYCGAPGRVWCNLAGKKVKTEGNARRALI